MYIGGFVLYLKFPPFQKYNFLNKYYDFKIFRNPKNSIWSIKWYFIVYVVYWRFYNYSATLLVIFLQKSEFDLHRLCALYLPLARTIEPCQIDLKTGYSKLPNGRKRYTKCFCFIHQGWLIPTVCTYILFTLFSNGFSHPYCVVILCVITLFFGHFS